MLRIYADENFDHDILRGLQLRLAELDVVTVQSERLAGLADPELLAHAAAQNRIFLTHDLNTIPRFAYERVRAGSPMAGVFAVPASLPIGQAIEELALLINCSLDGEWSNRVVYLPL